MIFNIKYLIGGYGSFGRVILDSGYAKSKDEFLNKFWKRHEGMLDCVKPVILSLCEVKKLEEIPCVLTHQEQYGY